ncbi:MAG: heavy metal-binding domain-containing protein [Candidatus Desantisbacteria bacterium]
MKILKSKVVGVFVLVGLFLVSAGIDRAVAGSCGGGVCVPGGTKSCPADKGTQTQGHQETQPGGMQAEAVYTCPMHHEVVSDKPGKCPKCGMNLELKKKEGVSLNPQKKEDKGQYFEEIRYACPMHHEIVSDKPGKCPKCGMNLEKMETKTFSYLCPQKRCAYKSKEPGKCPHHKKKLKKQGVKLYCPHTGAELKIQEDGQLYCPKCKEEILAEEAKIKKK